MPKNARNRSRTRSRSVSPPTSRRRRRHKSDSRSKSRDDVNNSLKNTLDEILSRLSNLEDTTSARSTSAQCATPTPLPGVPETPVTDNDPRVLSDIPTPTPSVAEAPVSDQKRMQVLTDVINVIANRGGQNFYVSNFDPSIHDVDAWCEEVERARVANCWNNYECLSRVAGCLKGDPKSWLIEWVSNDRTWTNFKKEFKPLCARKLDYANILFEAMSMNSDQFSTYADYARRSLLRLRIVKGVSEELSILIVIRGISDPQVKAAAANAELTAESIVPFLSMYSKPSRTKKDHVPFNKTTSPRVPFKRPQNTSGQNIKCYSCGELGHKSINCPKKRKTTENQPPATSISCTFCKKPGHKEDRCFAKDRMRNQKNVNLCQEPQKDQDSDITSAVVQGIPIDVLIDSGALNVSLISEDVLKYFSCARKPTYCTLKGIGDKEIVSREIVTLTIEFENIALEVNLVVVPAGSMSTPIIIGTDVLNRDGVVYVRTKNTQYLTRSVSSAANNVIATKDNSVLCVNSPLQGNDREQLFKIINAFSEFFITGTATTTVKTGEMHIKLNDNTPVAYHPYRLSYQEKLKVREIIKDLLGKGIIRESESPYSSPIILVKKKDGTDRMCVDFRALNRLTVKDRYPLPLIDDHIDRLGSSRYFSSLDMATGFHQIKIAQDSIYKTGFVTPEGHYEYLKMPYGLSNSPIVYQRIINNTLRKFIDAGQVLVYIDDVLIMSMSIAEGMKLLRLVLETLTQAGFSVNLKKCTFLTTEIEYLGRVISEGQVRPSPHKIEALVNAPIPTTVRQVRQFLGLAGYFRKYIANYATKTSCIAHLTKQEVKFAWGPEQEKVRQELISCLTDKPILTIFNPSLPTELHTDASSLGYGAVLMQTQNDARKSVVAYFSKSTEDAESRYHSYQLETLAVVKALKHFRHYLIGIKFKIITDCNALKATERKKDLLPRVARWWIYLQDFNYTIEYRKGVMMQHADYLSRNPPSAHVNHIPRPRNWAQIAQAADDETRNLIQRLEEGSLDPTRYVVKKDILYYRFTPIGEEARLLCFIPKGHRLSLLRLFHDEHEHISAEKTLDLILKHFWFPGLRTFVNKYTAHCLVCISKKRVPRSPHQPIHSWEKPCTPFDTIHVDVLGPLPESNGYKFVLVMIDAFTKYCLLYPLYRQDVSELKRVMTQAVSLFGPPKRMVTDRGRMFESTEFVNWVRELGCNMHYITPEMHHANGQVERYIRTTLNMIRIEVQQKNASWSDVLWRLQLVLNITKQKTTQRSALNLLVGIEATTPLIQSLVRDVAIDGVRPNREALRELSRDRAAELLQRNQIRQDTHVNKHRVPPKNYNVGDLVFVIKYSQSTGKLDPGMRGPYEVTKVLQNGRYEMKLLGSSYGKKTLAAAEFMVAWRGEWCPDACAAFFDGEENDESPAASGITTGTEAVDTSMPDPPEPSASEELSDSAGRDDQAAPSPQPLGRDMPLLD